MANSKVSDLNQKKNTQQSGKDISRSPGSGDHKASDQQAKIPQGQQAQHGQLGTDGDRQAKGGSGQHK
ncbi:hypothetical protein [Rhodoferax saidenbachensis]|jgi:hypothetical protein|uniref:Uncharacterized protein n=1 Tax=Rhodoferax saidenbachensis TaxID=1484693 RepID=A0ABU1ZRF2_9BURK|nr:hypothetical protein [Rhodoferax saidenbachensis]MDR7307450.1 hypothetical protein [Rhodoferax saidenbachensis]